MISYDEALTIVRAHRWPAGSESVPLSHSMGRRLAQSVFAELDAPPYTSSAMDGFAVGSLEGPWSIVGAAPAGSIGPIIAPGQAIRINTGSLIPEGAISVIPQEDAHVQSEELRAEPAQMGAHIRIQGEEYFSGALLFSAPTRVTPPVVSALAAQGMQCVPVTAMPRVALLSTGAELLKPGAPYVPGRVYDSNSAGIAPILERLGCRVTRMTVTDDATSTAAAVGELISNHDLLVTIGGVSVGDFDFVRPSVTQHGFEVRFSGVAIKPGKPCSFGTRADGKVWIGLPGNPMSALVTLCLFGLEYLGEPLEFHPMTLVDGLSRKTGREEFMPAYLSPWLGEVLLSPTVGSHATSGLSLATGLARIPAELSTLTPGDRVEVAAFPWSGRP